jgi:hypothetical protein
MSLVDPTFINAPEVQTRPGVVTGAEYTMRAWSIIFEGFKAGLAPPRFAANTGIVYVVRQTTTASGLSADTGIVIAAIRPTDPPFILTSAALNRNDFNLYQFFIDADTAADACNVCALIM